MGLEIMSSCITLRYPSFPVPEEITIPNPNPAPPAGAPANVTLLTYGGHLVNFGAAWQNNPANAPLLPRSDQHVIQWARYSPELRNLVARCMCHFPADRPDLTQLQAEITNGRAAYLAGRTPYQNRSDARRVKADIGEPAPPPTQTPQNLQDVSATLSY